MLRLRAKNVFLGSEILGPAVAGWASKNGPNSVQARQNSPPIRAIGCTFASSTSLSSQKSLATH